ncbi:MAG: hypothetical protein ABW278_04285 [Steroidobacteraceae bacterium]
MKPASRAAAQPMVVYSWDGKSLPFDNLQLDTPPEFSWLLFDYSGTQTPGIRTLRGQQVLLLSGATECKGEVLSAVAEHLIAADVTPEYVGIIDDDVVISISQFNQALDLGRRARLDVFSPTLSPDSVVSHQWMVTQGRRTYREEDWVEVMMPFYRGSLFLAGRDFYRSNISSWGVDCYLIPTLQQISGETRTALLDTVVARHIRPVTSGHRVYKNGLMANQEMGALRDACIAHLQAQAPHLVGTPWFQRIFGPRGQNSWQRRIRRRWRDLIGRVDFHTDETTGRQ